MKTAAKSLRSIALILLWAAVGSANAQHAERVPAPIYKPKPGACYVLLRPRWTDYEHIASSNEPVCRTVLDNFNQYCEEQPQYDKRKLHPTSTALSEPEWVSMDLASNLELVKWVLAPNETKEYRENSWLYAVPQLSTGQAKLKRADVVNADRQHGVNTVYMAEDLSADRGAGYNQARIMFSEKDQSTPSPRFKRVWASESSGDLWKFEDRWYVVGYNTRTAYFEVRELTALGPDPPWIAALTTCSIEHINDRQARLEPR